MSETVIKVENLSKQYRIGSREGYKTFRETLVDTVKAPFSVLRCKLSALGSGPSVPGSMPSSRGDDYIWALKDISFQVKQGEVVGIIGRNGAGKTTLLKILSEITEPTEGRVELKGRVGSLLEVGTGFHPELTGHENVYLYGAILGMDRWEVTRKFDEIVAFAEIERFIDTPVKRYSSGMYMRLAFAVAAHLEPEILLVDEVLAVGDIQFQKKCLGKMGEVATEGRTVLFVSHNLGAISNLCKSAILLDMGRIMTIASAKGAISQYLHSIVDMGSGEVELDKTSSEAYFTKISTLDSKGHPTAYLPLTEDFKIRFEFDVLREIKGLEVSFSLYDENGTKLFYSGASKSDFVQCLDFFPGRYIAEATIPAIFLVPGMYTIRAGLHQPNFRMFDQRSNVLRFNIIETGSQDYRYNNKNIGSILVQFKWMVKQCDEADST
jgi:lipopolysaccharide transport system ATP-binding protein